MATYATEADIIARYSNDELLLVADRDGDGTADTGVVTQAVTDASAEIDAYLGMRYDLPLASTPDVIVRVAVDIAMYRMAETAAAVTEEKRKRYEDAVSFLRAISKGVATLGIAEPSDSSPNSMLYASETRTWTRANAKGLF